MQARRSDGLSWREINTVCREFQEGMSKTNPKSQNLPTLVNHGRDCQVCGSRWA